MKYPKLFKKQKMPDITEKVFDNLVKQGLVVAETTTHESEKRVAEVSNPTAGQVVGYGLLAEKLKQGYVTQTEARQLLCIEAARPNGARETHIARLINIAFMQDKNEILEAIENYVATETK